MSLSLSLLLLSTLLLDRCWFSLRGWLAEANVPSDTVPPFFFVAVVLVLSALATHAAAAAACSSLPLLLPLPLPLLLLMLLFPSPLCPRPLSSSPIGCSVGALRITTDLLLQGWRRSSRGRLGRVSAASPRQPAPTVVPELSTLTRCHLTLVSRVRTSSACAAPQLLAIASLFSVMRNTRTAVARVCRRDAPIWCRFAGSLLAFRKGRESATRMEHSLRRDLTEDLRLSFLSISSGTVYCIICPNQVPPTRFEMGDLRGSRKTDAFEVFF